MTFVNWNCCYLSHGITWVDVFHSQCFSPSLGTRKLRFEGSRALRRQTGTEDSWEIAELLKAAPLLSRLVEVLAEFFQADSLVRHCNLLIFSGAYWRRKNLDLQVLINGSETSDAISRLNLESLAEIDRDPSHDPLVSHYLESATACNNWYFDVLCIPLNMFVESKLVVTAARWRILREDWRSKLSEATWHLCRSGSLDDDGRCAFSSDLSTVPTVVSLQIFGSDKRWICDSASLFSVQCLLSCLLWLLSCQVQTSHCHGRIGTVDRRQLLLWDQNFFGEFVGPGSRISEIR